MPRSKIEREREKRERGRRGDPRREETSVILNRARKISQFSNGANGAQKKISPDRDPVLFELRLRVGTEESF